MTIKAIGVDFFGTLVEAEADHNKCVSSMFDCLRGCGYEISNGDFISNYRATATEHRKIRNEDLIEVSNRVWVADTLRGMGHKVEPSSPHVLSAVETYFNQWKITLYPDALSFLEGLRGRFRVVLVSNFTDSTFLNQTLNKLGIIDFFDYVVDSDWVGWRKPHPNIFKRFLELSRVRAEEALFVGDDVEADVKGAKEMGIMTVLLLRSARKLINGSKAEIQPDLIVNSLSELGELLHKEFS